MYVKTIFGSSDFRMFLTLRTMLPNLANLTFFKLCSLWIEIASEAQSRCSRSSSSQLGPPPSSSQAFFPESTSEISIVVKASLKTVFVKLLSSIARPFVKEVFWYEEANPQLKKLYPEIASISPGTTWPPSQGMITQRLECSFDLPQKYIPRVG